MNTGQDRYARAMVRPYDSPCSWVPGSSLRDAPE
jgi:hypothetical protein